MAKSNFKATIQQPIKKVWETVTDLKNYSWRSDIEKIEIISDKEFIEYTKDGFKTVFTTTVFMPHERWEFDMENKNIKGHWVGLFFDHGDKTMIDFTEDIQCRKFFLKPFFKIFIDRYLQKQQQHYFQDLQRELERK
ncbi:SRPBCC family protein [Treponema phagedenis]|uniref:SRPBCC family protein n=2 Tax=Treponema phagedenis TaxID=162 RepID=A0A0B7GW30_TREPH|nr:SRPBCC family protein [Treponema phagedenis]NVP23206.1 SRPBCC family protein [Treponema phagedenis]QEJ95526.1 SRPBCC family protein [Treponema phagedenis]QEJ97989.1 SRPBCC family protein [Treponema phagedenis]QEK01380.1 SRPBCC family protein [Treponema phagedenis]QEK03496.1 SRPBCC family protein [Treponema phagedenis]